MDKSEHYRDIIEQTLKRIAASWPRLQEVKACMVFDRNSDHYLALTEGWDKARRIHQCVVHLEIINGKIWIQEDLLEHGVAADLEEAGIPKSDIVLGFYPQHVRPHTEYAAA